MHVINCHEYSHACVSCIFSRPVHVAMWAQLTNGHAKEIPIRIEPAHNNGDRGCLIRAHTPAGWGSPCHIATRRGSWQLACWFKLLPECERIIWGSERRHCLHEAEGEEERGGRGGREARGRGKDGRREERGERVNKQQGDEGEERRRGEETGRKGKEA